MFDFIQKKPIYLYQYQPIVHAQHCLPPLFTSRLVAGSSGASARKSGYVESQDTDKHAYLRLNIMNAENKKNEKFRDNAG